MVSRQERIANYRDIINSFTDNSVTTYRINEASNVPPEALRPQPEWEEDSYSEDWRTDGYNWRQQSQSNDYPFPKKYMFDEQSEDFKRAERDNVTVQVSYYPFKLRVGRGESKAAFTTKFRKKAYKLSNVYPNKVLVIYEGDASVINQTYSHGNARKEEKIRKTYYRTAKSVISSAKERENEQPSEVYGNMIEKAGPNMKKQAIHAPRDLKQIFNAQSAARRSKKLTHDALYNAFEVGNETDFMRKFELFPEVNLACMHFDMSYEFQRLLDRTDLPAVIMEYDTTFNMGNFYVSWLAFRHTEFEDLPANPMPTIGLACFIHTSKSQASHEYFFNMIKDEVPMLKDAKNVLMCTDEESGIVNAFKKVFPNIPHTRCHIHAWRNMKAKLRKLGIASKEELKTYRDQFYELLHKDSYEEYCGSLETFEKHVWDEAFAVYFSVHIHPSMKEMGLWSLERYGVKNILSTNRMESFNALLKRRFTKHRGYGEDEIISGSSEISRRQLLRCKRAKHGVGENWLLRQELRESYPLEDVSSELYDLDTDLLQAKKEEIEPVSAPKGLPKTYIPSPTVLQRAKTLILENRISLVPQQKSFSVRAHDGVVHSVYLFSGEHGDPKQYCSCPSTVTCSHIMAAMLSIGYRPRESKKRPNATTMRRNLKYSKSGTKGNATSTKKEKKKASTNGLRKLKRKNPKDKNLDDFYALNPYAEEAELNRIERYHASIDRESIEGSSGSSPKFSKKRKYSSNSKEDSDKSDEGEQHVEEKKAELQPAKIIKEEKKVEDIKANIEKDEDITERHCIEREDNPSGANDSQWNSSEDDDSQSNASSNSTNVSKSRWTSQYDVASSKSSGSSQSFDEQDGIVDSRVESEDNPSRAVCQSNASSNSTTCSKSSGNRNVEGTLPDDNQDEIDVVTEIVVDSAGNQKERSLFHETVLEKFEINAMLTKQFWLDDNHMNAAATILKRQFKDIGGFMSVRLSQFANFPKPKEDKYIQFLHSPKHWVVVAKGFFGCKTIRVYDSLNFNEQGRRQVLACMSSLVRTDAKEMLYEVAPCQRMADKEIGDCGVLAIAFATSIAHGIDPSPLFFNGSDIRKHLFNCFLSGEMSIFPATPRRSTKRECKTRSIPVFCSCRRTDFRENRDWELIECGKCREWFHRMCVGPNFPENPEKVEWYCNNCS